MRNKILIFTASIIAVFTACDKDDLTESEVTETSIPFVVEQFVEPGYAFGVGSGNIFKTIPDTIALAVDTIVGFEGGFGGKTGSDSIYILKEDLKGEWPDTTTKGGISLQFEKFNRSSFGAHVTTSIALAEPIAAPDSPGPTDISGTYLRPANGFTFDIVKVFDGVYVIDNPGGAGVAPTPYLLYNYKNAAGKDSLAFDIQSNPCGGGLQLVDPNAPLSLTSADYSASYPPAILSLSPLTLSWKVLEFPEASPSTANTGAALCQWGTGARTFVKQ